MKDNLEEFEIALLNYFYLNFKLYLKQYTSSIFVKTVYKDGIGSIVLDLEEVTATFRRQNKLDENMAFYLSEILRLVVNFKVSDEFDFYIKNHKLGYDNYIFTYTPDNQVIDSPPLAF